jgi:hypothetical protein
MLTAGKNGVVMKYTFWPGLGKRPSMLNNVNDAMAPESSLPGSPAWDVLKEDGISIHTQTRKG